MMYSILNLSDKASVLIIRRMTLTASTITTIATRSTLSKHHKADYRNIKGVRDQFKSKVPLLTRSFSLFRKVFPRTTITSIISSISQSECHGHCECGSQHRKWLPESQKEVSISCWFFCHRFAKHLHLISNDHAYGRRDTSVYNHFTEWLYVEKLTHMYSRHKFLSPSYIPTKDRRTFSPSLSTWQWPRETSIESSIIVEQQRNDSPDHIWHRLRFVSPQEMKEQVGFCSNN